ncbi:MAG: hypothetical protein QXM92_04220 [Candidatus Anstonellales archaeon]
MKKEAIRATDLLTKEELGLVEAVPEIGRYPARDYYTLCMSLLLDLLNYFV